MSCLYSRKIAVNYPVLFLTSLGALAMMRKARLKGGDVIGH